MHFCQEYVYFIHPDQRSLRGSKGQICQRSKNIMKSCSQYNVTHNRKVQLLLLDLVTNNGVSDGQYRDLGIMWGIKIKRIKFPKR